MYNKENLILSHVFLYAKGWYKRTSHIWEGFIRCFHADGHYTPLTKQDVAYLLLKIVMENKEAIFHNRADVDMYIMGQIRENIDRLVHWYPKDIEGMKADDIYDTAVILFCHSALQFTDKSIFKSTLIPDKRVLPLRVGDGETNRDAKKRAREYFGKDAKPYEVQADSDFYKRHFENLNSYMSYKDFLKDYKVEYITPRF